MLTPKSPHRLEPILATIEDVSFSGGWRRSTTYTLMKEGKLESVKVGKRRLIVVASLHAYINSLRTKEPSNGE